MQVSLAKAREKQKEYDKVASLINSGFSYREVGKMMKRTHNWVWLVYKKRIPKNLSVDKS